MKKQLTQAAYILSCVSYSNQEEEPVASTMHTATSRSLADSPYRGTIFINEVATTTTSPPIFECPFDWIELINTGNVTVNFTGFILHDNRGPTSVEAYTFGLNSGLRAQGIVVFCRNILNAFRFDIDTNDTVTLLDSNGDLVSTTGVLPNGGGNATSTYQRTSYNTYMYGRPTPYRENFLPTNVSIFINEVASSATNVSICPGSEWIELFNAENSITSVTGFVLHDDRGPTNNESFIFPLLFFFPKTYIVLCGQHPSTSSTSLLKFKFDIDSNDTITFLDNYGQIISTTGILPNGGNATSTYQRTPNNTYMYGFPTPDAENFRDTIPAPTTVSSPIQTLPIPIPVSVPTPIVPIPVQVKTLPTRVPFDPSSTTDPIWPPTPIPAPTKSPTIAPISSNTNCGLFGLNFFCPRRGECGFWRRLLNLRNC